MDDSLQTSLDLYQPILVPAGEDRFNQIKQLGVSSIAYKVTSHESKDLFAMEITLVQKGGPARHVHLYQDEWFYVVEGEFLLEVGNEQFRLKPGDSAFGPKMVPHVWAFVAGDRGKMIFAVSPVGKVEEFFNNLWKTKSPPGTDQNQWQPYGLEWVGPPLQV